LSRSRIVATIAVFWAGLVLGRAFASGFAFDEGAYGNGQKFAVALAVLVLIVGARELLKSSRISR
jgi:hypothetical protein